MKKSLIIGIVIINIALFMVLGIVHFFCKATGTMELRHGWIATFCFVALFLNTVALSLYTEWEAK